MAPRVVTSSAAFGDRARACAALCMIAAVLIACVAAALEFAPRTTPGRAVIYTVPHEQATATDSAVAAAPSDSEDVPAGEDVATGSAPAVRRGSNEPIDAAAALTTSEELTAVITDALAGFDGAYSVSVHRLDGSLAASVRGDQAYYAASLFKLAVLFEAGRRLDSGDLALDAILPVGEQDIAEDDGTFGSVPRDENGNVVVADALAAMVEISDTTTGNAFLHLFGHATVDA